MYIYGSGQPYSFGIIFLLKKRLIARACALHVPCVCVIRQTRAGHNYIGIYGVCT